MSPMCARVPGSAVKPTPAPQRRGRFRVGRVLGALGLTVLLLLSGAVLLHRSILEAYAPAILETLTYELKEFYELGFAYEEARVAGLTDYTITGVILTDLPSGRLLLTCDSMRIRSNLAALGLGSLQGQDQMLGISSVELHHPVITLGREEGRWNTGTLLEPSRGGGYRFPGRLGVIIRDGVIEWLGGEITDGAPFPPWKVDGLQGAFTLDLNWAMALRLMGTLSSADMNKTPITVQGVFDPERYLFEVTAEADAVDLRLLGPWLEKYHIQELSGLAETDISLLIGDTALTGEAGYSLLGRARMREGTLGTDLADILATNLAGDVQFSHRSLFTSGLTGEVDGSPITVRGRIGDFGAVAFDLVCDTSDLWASTAQSLLPAFRRGGQGANIPIEGRLDAHVEVSGPPGDLAFLVSANSQNLSSLGISFRLNDLVTWYSDDKLVVSRCEIDAMGGSVSAEGTVDFTGEEPAPPKYRFRVAAKDFPSEHLAAWAGLVSGIPADLVPHGTLQADLDITGEGWRFPEATGLVEAESVRIPRYPELPPLRITAPISVATYGYASRLYVAGASAVGEGFTALAEGSLTVPPRAGGLQGGLAFDGSVAVTLDDPALIGEITNLPLTGELAVAGDLSYSNAEGVRFSGEGHLGNGRLGILRVPSLSGKIELDRDAVRLRDLAGLLDGAQLAGELIIPLDSRGEDMGHFEVQGLDLGRMLPPEYAALVSTSLDLSGDVTLARDENTAGAVILDLSVVEPGARVGPNVLSTNEQGVSVEVTYPLDGGDTSTLQVSGQVNSEPAGPPTYEGRVLTPYSARVIREITDLITGETGQLEEDTPRIPVISGDFTLTAELADLLGATHGTVDITSEDLTVSGWELDRGSLRLSSSEGAVWEIELIADSGEAGSFEMRGRIGRGETWQDSALELQAAIIDSGLNQVFALLGLGELGRFSGSLSGRGDITGTLSTPVVESFLLNLSESEAFGIPIEQGGISFGYSAPNLTFQDLDLEGGSGFRAMGAGSIDVTSPSIASATLAIGLEEFDLGLLPRAIRKDIPIGGVITAAVQLAHDGLGPKVYYDAQIVGASVSIGEDSLPLGDLSFQAVSRPGDRQFELTNLELQRDGEIITASGTLPTVSIELITLLKGLASGQQGHLDTAALSELPGLLLSERLDLTITSHTGYTPPVPAGILASGIAWDGGLGPVDLHFGGSILYPSLTGQVDLAVTGIRLGELPLAEGIIGTFRLEDSVVTASPDEIRVVGSGWALGIEGQADLVAFMHDYLAQQFPWLGDWISLLVPPGPSRVPADTRLAVAPIDEGPVRLSGPGYAVRIALGSGEDAPALQIRDEGLVVSGKVRVLGGDIDLGRLPIIPLPETMGETSLFSLDLHAQLDGTLQIAGGGVFDYGFELGFNSGSLSVVGPSNDPVVSGTMMAPTGWLDILGNHFVLIEPLEMSLTFSPPSRFDPHVVTAAQTTLRNVRSPDAYEEEVVVTARINSRMSNLLESVYDGLSSEPPLGRDQLMAALATEHIIIQTLGGSLFGEGFGAPGFQDVEFGSLLLPLASSYLSQHIRRHGGFADFELSFDPEQRIRLYIESEVLDRLVMYYRQTFGPDAEDNYLWGARYRWRPRSWVGFEVDSDEEITPQIKYIIPLD